MNSIAGSRPTLLRLESALSAPMPRMTHQVGHLTEIDPEDPEDPEYPNMSQAAARATQLSSLRPASGFGIWKRTKGDTRLLAIAYAGELFWNDTAPSDGLAAAT